MKIRYTLPALADLDSTLTYISATSPKGAARVQKRIQDAISLLLAHPEIGLRTDDPEIRRLITTPYPFLIFYEIGVGRSSSTLSVIGLAILARCRVRVIPSSSHPP